VTNGDGYEAFRNKGHQLYLLALIPRLKRLNFLKMLQHLHKCRFTLVQIIALNNHNLPGKIWHLIVFVHDNTIYASILYNLINQNPRRDAFFEILVLDEDAEWEDFTLFDSSPPRQLSITT